MPRPTVSSTCPRGSITCTLCLLDAGLFSRVGSVAILAERTSSLTKGHRKGLCCCGRRYLFVCCPTLQGAKVLRHDQPLPDAPGRKLCHSLPIGYQNKCLVEHLLRRLSALSVLHSAHNGHEDTHLLTVLLPLGVVVDVLGSSHGERRVEDVSVERFYLIMHVLALGLEELGVVGGCGHDSAVDGDVCGDGVSRRRVDVEG